jgi:serine/threonine protein kinase/predicted ATPase
LRAGIQPSRAIQPVGGAHAQSAPRLALEREEEAAMHPTGKPDPDEPSGDLTVKADSAFPSAAEAEVTLRSESTLPIAETPGEPAELVPKKDDPLAPASFGRYQVRNTLATGGYGVVYLGHDTQLDRPVAIKVLRGGSNVPKHRAQEFLQEARRLAQLSHPGIVAIHDVGLDRGQIYIVSDFLDGPHLGRWLRDHRPVWPEAAGIAAAVADALAHAHSRLIIHRDIKPANIIMTVDRGPVLVDFGIGLDEAGAGGAELGAVTGTPVYMAPEQIAGAAHRIDGRTDIYSLGVVLYQMLCGRMPFRANNLHELLRQVRDDEPQPPRQLNRDIPPELETICLKALAKRLGDRYTTAADFAVDLQRVRQSAAAGPASSVSSRQSFRTPLSRGPHGAPSASFQQDAQPSSSSRRRAREAERRQVTMLCCGCDLFESDAYLGNLDAEDQSAVLKAFQRACEEAVRGFDGALVQCSEQGLLACFGYPAAHEDAAWRAVRAGLGILDQMVDLGARVGRQHGLELKPWVGIHTGVAVVETAQDAVSVVGDARNVAVRLEDVALPGQVVMTAATHRLVRGRFDCTSLGYRKLKGISQPLELFWLQGMGEELNPIAVAVAQRVGLSPLTGRDHEISLLKDRWEHAREGMGQVVLIIGEPGLGKSRLVHTLKEYVLGQMFQGEGDSPVVEWRCSPHFQNTALYPAINFYERALGFGREEPPQARFDRLLYWLKQYNLARPETVPLWASLLSLPCASCYPAVSSSPNRKREETFRAMLEWLHTRAARQSVLFVVEDLHWVDASTLEFLGQFLAEGLHDSILTLFTFRPEFQTPWPAVAHQTSLALNRLTRRQVAELMRKKMAGALPEEVIEQIYNRAGGVPLFVEEFAKMVQESGGPDHAGAGDARVYSLPARAIPSTLEDLVMARLDRMEGERDLAQLAATLGREFSYDVLAAAAGLDEPMLQAKLAALVQAEILYPKGLLPRCVYIFKHALLEDALYNALIKSKRQEFHRRIAAVLEERFPQTTETQPEVLAHHWTLAGATEPAIGYWLKAGLRSRENAANREAIGQLTRGLALLETLEETHEHDEQKLKTLATLAPAFIAVRGYAAPEVGPILHRAGELCERIGDELQQFGIMLGNWEWHLVRGDLRESVRLADLGMTLAERRDEPGMLMEALFMRGATMFYRGQFADARACYEKAVAELDDRERTRFWTGYSGHNAGVTHRCYLALVLWHLGYPDQALRLDRETDLLARTIGHAFSLGHAVDFTAFLGHHCRLGAEVQKAAEEEIAIATDQHFQLWHALGTLHQGAGMLVQGRRDEALPLLLKGFSAFRATGAGVRVSAYLGVLGDAYTQSGRFEDAHQALDEGLEVAEKNDDRCHEAELHRLKGELLLAESAKQDAAALDCFRRAIEKARDQRSKAWELRATMSLARLWQRLGRREDAHAALAAVYSTYTEGFTTPDLVDARAILEALVGRQPSIDGMIGVAGAES